MFLAIIMDIYGAAKAVAGSSDSKVTQSKDMLTEFINRRHRVPDEDVCKIIDQLSATIASVRGYGQTAKWGYQTITFRCHATLGIFPYNLHINVQNKKKV